LYVYIGSFSCFNAIEEKVCAPLAMLKAATINSAAAYGNGDQLCTLEPGKVADLLVLGKNPLQAAENYRTIETVIQGGRIVDTVKLPERNILTRPLEPSPEEAGYLPFVASRETFPMCHCMRRQCYLSPHAHVRAAALNQTSLLFDVRLTTLVNFAARNVTRFRFHLETLLQ
jgi:hypothetical protein